MFIILILLVIGAIYFLRQQEQRGPLYSDNAKYQTGSSKDALDILRERYARGEISEQEFNERKKVLHL